MNCIIFPHIPKCAGTSIHKQILEANIKLYLDYDHPPHLLKYFAEACQRRNQECSLLDFNAFDLVFGHFPAHRYRRPGYRHVILLRDPLERAISHYSYWKNILPATNLFALHRNPVIREIKSGALGFAEFAQTINIYALYLDGMRPEDFLLAGFMDRYPQFLSEVSTLLGIPLAPDVRERQSPRESLSDKELSKAAVALKDEFRIYEAYRKHWEGQAS